MARPIDERLAEIEAKQNKLKQIEKKLRAEQSKQARNARTKRLIETGAVVESVLGKEFNNPKDRESFKKILEKSFSVYKAIGDVLGRPISEDEIPLLSAFLKQQEDRGQFFTKALSRKE